MKLIFFLVLGSCVVSAVAVRGAENPFYSQWNTPFEVPDFARIKTGDYMPAFKKGMADQRAEVNAIANNPAPPTFANTVEALEGSGALLRRVSDVFFNLNSSDTNDEMQKIAKEVSPLLSRHNDDINLNKKLFERIRAVHEQRDTLGLGTEQKRLLDVYYKDFVRGGAALPEEKKARFREINERLSVLQLKFGENVLDETNRFELVIDNRDDLDGLPDGVIETAAATAKKRGHEGKWVFTLHKPSLIPFLTYSTRRDLREKIYRGYFMQGDHNDEYDNKNVVREIVALRAERAHLLGFATHAAYILDDNMAKTPGRVYDLLNRLWKPSLRRATQERDDMQKMIDAEGGKFKLAPWDWWYYAEKVKKAKYNFDDEALRPYFQLENVRKGAFEVAHRLFGITFEERFDIPRYNDEVRTFEVKDADGSHLAIYLVDYFPRASKRGGAWMSPFRKQSRLNGNEITPIVVNVANLSRPSGDEPALLSLEETRTLFHEFGHALHGMLSNCTYHRLSGTDVARDFVEMPSQVFENWALEPEVLNMYAHHYKTGKPIPAELIEKMKRARLFNQGFATTEYLAASYLDMDWHTLSDTIPRDVDAFEKHSMNRIHLIPEIIPRYRSTYFRHIFSGGYSAGYYSYIWAQVLDADAFQAFKENGLFDPKTAAKFRKYILSAGDTEEPMELYRKFRGRDPEIGPLLNRRGLN